MEVILLDHQRIIELCAVVPETFRPIAEAAMSLASVEVEIARKPDLDRIKQLEAALNLLIQHCTQSHLCYPNCIEQAQAILDNKQQPIKP